jgi:hypothetical protein
LEGERNWQKPKFSGSPGEIYFENSSKYYLKSSLNKLRIALHSMLRKDFVVFSKLQNHLGLGVEIWFFKYSYFLNIPF